MKVKIFLYAICIFVLVIIQSTFLEYIKIYNIKPNLLIVFVIAVALLRGNVEGAVVGLILGLLQDVISGRVIGFYGLLGMYLGVIIGSVNKRLYRENFFVIIFFTLAASITYESIVFILTVFLKYNADILYSFRTFILPEAVYNSVLSVFIYIIVIKLSYKFEEAGKITRKY